MHITDFGIARLWNSKNGKDSSGTPGYMCIIINKIAPEVISGLNHGIGVDYFALGVIVYECMLGKVLLH